MRRWAHRTVGAVALAALSGIFLGCMNLSIAERTTLAPGCQLEAEVLCQEGRVTLAPEEMRVVHFPLPYASEPNLELDASECVKIQSEEPASFVLCNRSEHFSKTVTWKARGQRKAAAPPPPREAPPPDPPERPVPVEKPDR